MTPERWQKIDEILEDALARAPSERSAFLETACAGDDELRREVEALILSHERAGSFIEKPAVQVDARVLAQDKKGSAVGRTFGAYKIVGPLGAGGMGEVYLAEDMRVERRVALKLLPDLFSDDEQRVRRFQQEARAVIGLNHPNIVTIYEIGNEREAYFIATELVQGETLRERLRRGALKLSEALEISVQVARALAAAHEAGVIHRDVKPENIMIRQDGYVKVLDFGLAKLVETRTDTGRVDTKANTRVLVSTDTGVVMGTVDYMSPEQARGLRVDERTDVWSIGCVLYEMAAGRRPFEGGTKTDVIASVLEHDPPPLARYLPDAPAELQRIISKVLSKERDERYQTVKDLLIDLRNLKRTLELEAELKRTGHSTDASGRSVALSAHEDEKQSAGAVGASAAHTSVIPPAQPTSSAEYLIHEVRRHKTGALVALLVLVSIAAGAVLLALKYARREQRAAAPFEKIKVTRLTNTGKASFAVVSPDGKYVVHVLGGKGKHSLWLRHISTGSDQEIVPSTGDDIANLTFSNDGSYVYFNRWEVGRNVLYQVAVLGGTPRRLLSEDVDTPVTFSPDGKRYAFFRGDPPNGEGYIIVANADGSNEQKIVTGNIRDFFVPATSPAWSPDGEVLAYGFKSTDAAGHSGNLFTVRVKDGIKKQVTAQKWNTLGTVRWLRDGSGLIVTASEQDSGPARQIWYVSYPNGEARRITNDLNNYQDVSITADSSALVTVVTEKVSNVWLSSNGDASRATQLTSNRSDGTYGFDWTPDGRILYTSQASGNNDIWIMNADGTGSRQLTTDARSNVRPSASSDGRYVVFSSNRTGKYHIWRMDIDGSNPKELTFGAVDQHPTITPDSQWVIYTANESNFQRLFKVPIDGGDAVQFNDYSSANAAVSPDGKLIVCGYVDEQGKPRRWRYGIVSSDGGPPLKTFDFPYYFRQTVSWTADGRALVYVDTRAGISNLWSQPVSGGQPKQLTDFKSDQIFTYAWSRDRRQLALARGSETSDVVMINDLK